MTGLSQLEKCDPFAVAAAPHQTLGEFCRLGCPEWVLGIRKEFGGPRWHYPLLFLALSLRSAGSLAGTQHLLHWFDLFGLVFLLGTQPCLQLGPGHQPQGGKVGGAEGRRPLELLP